MAKRQRTKLSSFCFSIALIIVCLSCCYPGESRPPFACDPSNAIAKTFPFCTASLHIRDRVNDLLKRLTLQEKIRLLVNNAAPVERLGIRGYEWWSEALHGVAISPGVHFGGEFPAQLVSLKLSPPLPPSMPRCGKKLAGYIWINICAPYWFFFLHFSHLQLLFAFFLIMWFCNAFIVYKNIYSYVLNNFLKKIYFFMLIIEIDMNYELKHYEQNVMDEVEIDLVGLGS